MNKKALSTTLENTLIISIAIIALSVMFLAISPLIKLKLSPPPTCEELIRNPYISFNKLSFDIHNSNIKVYLNKEKELKEISSIKFEIVSENKNISWECGTSCGSCKLEYDENLNELEYLLPLEKNEIDFIMEKNVSLIISIYNCKLIEKKFRLVDLLKN
ncbi:MAG: hypothetical protein QW273_00405 [Candidatus Pacearchaeota archaeon]